jgi:hypothetical protein
MNTGAAALLLLVVAVGLANLAFFTERLFLLIVLRKSKSLWWRLLEVLVYYGIFIGLGRALEAYVGRLHAQAWQFYAITLLIFFVLAYPGFIYRYLRRTRRASSAGSS